MDNCPMCGFKIVNNGCQASYENGKYRIECRNNPEYFYIDESIEKAGVIDKKRRYNIIFSYLLKNHSEQKSYTFYFNSNETDELSGNENDINIFYLMKDYPNNYLERVDRCLINIWYYYFNIHKSEIDFAQIHQRLYYSEAIIESELHVEYNTLRAALVGLQYITTTTDNNRYTLAPKGWERLNKLLEMENEIKQGFIAMSFSSEADYIYQAFYEAIYDCGYNPMKISDKEHNNQIVPEIFYEIKRSKFVVVDVTYPNYGAYYEAGFAEALGKQVIICCKKDKFDEKTPHFDIAQKNSIVWIDTKDLIQKLKRRIEVTVGKND